jgi:gas vesicle protein
MKTFLLGLGVGIGLGIFFAPDSGEETRRVLRERLNNVGDEAKRQAGNVAQRVRDEL